MDRPVFLPQIIVGPTAPNTHPDYSVSGTEVVGHAFSHGVTQVAIAETLFSMNSGQIPTESDSQKANGSNELGIKILNNISLAKKKYFNVRNATVALNDHTALQVTCASTPVKSPSSMSYGDIAFQKNVT